VDKWNGLVKDPRKSSSTIILFLGWSRLVSATASSGMGSKTSNFDFLVKVPWGFGTEDTETSESVSFLSFFFKFYRIFGMCPMSWDGNALVVRRKLHPSWYPTWFALTIRIIMLLNFVATCFISFSKADSIGSYVMNGIYFTQLLVSGCFMAWKTKEIPRLIQSCIRADKVCRWYERRGRRPTAGFMNVPFSLFFLIAGLDVAGNVLYYASVGKWIQLLKIRNG